MERFIDLLVWPPHLVGQYPNPKGNPVNALNDYFKWTKGNWGIADFLAQYTEVEIPAFVKEIGIALKDLCDPPPAKPDADKAEAAA
jgi:putative ATP-dependent endonuclease of the OLD family